MFRFLVLCAVVGAILGFVATFVRASLTPMSAESQPTVHPQRESPIPRAQTEGIRSELQPRGEVTNYRVPILTYHYIGSNPNPTDRMRNTLSIDPLIFEQQMEYLVKEGYTTISLDTLIGIMDGKATIPGKPIILTFDDGYIDFYLNAYPILKKYQLWATVFIPTGRIGTPSYMTWEQMYEIQRDGLIQFEAHSVTHRDLTPLKSEELKNEIVQSKVELERRLGTIVNWFAYPYGKSNGVVVSQVRNAGFVGAVTTMDGVYHSKDNLYNLNRRSMSGANSLEIFRTKL